ncbi:MAG: hypothetical protein ACRC5C_04860 [Bacilli bacterium]
MKEQSKQEYTKFLKETYKKKLREGKLANAVRKAFLETKVIDPKKIKGPKNEDGSNASDGGDFIPKPIVGNMPTIADYNGPKGDYIHPKWGLYQTGLAKKIEGTDKWNDEIQKACEKHGVNPILTKVLMAIESGGSHSSKVNSSNCVGLLQVELDAQPAELRQQIINDPLVNIDRGVWWIKEKTKYAAGVISRGGSRFQDYKAMGHEAKPNAHGTAWFYNGFNIPNPTTQTNKWMNGCMFADQAAAMYAGFGRDAHVDTAYTMTVSKDTKVTGGASTPPQHQDIRSYNLSSEPEQFIEQGPVKAYVDEEEIEHMIQKLSIIEGQLRNERYLPPNVDRRAYFETLYGCSAFLNLQPYLPMDSRRFIHLAGPQENLYHPMAIKVFEKLRVALGYGKLCILRGFDPASKQSAHGFGIAVDILIQSQQEAKYIADTAWKLGLRAVSIEENYVHLDIGPAHSWSVNETVPYKHPSQQVQIQED